MKRLAAFKNPDFYRAQAMRLPTYGKPRVICTAEHFDEYLAIPRGCEKALIEKLKQSNASYTILDETNPGKTIPAAFNGTLREERVRACLEAGRHRGVRLSGLPPDHALLPLRAGRGFHAPGAAGAPLRKMAHPRHPGHRRLVARRSGPGGQAEGRRGGVGGIVRTESREGESAAGWLFPINTFNIQKNVLKF